MRQRNEPAERVAIRHDYVRKHVAQVIEKRSLPNRLAMRRQYLCKKVNVYTLAASRFLCWLVFVVAAALAGIPLLNSLQHGQNVPIPAILIFAAAIGTGAVMALLRGKYLADKARQQVEIYYAPPVKPESLPAEEVLLRSSNILSTAHDDGLLRPADSAQATAANSLLRASLPRDAVDYKSDYKTEIEIQTDPDQIARLNSTEA